jgi:hypothetical protein
MASSRFVHNRYLSTLVIIDKSPTYDCQIARVVCRCRKCVAPDSTIPVQLCAISCATTLVKLLSLASRVGLRALSASTGQHSTFKEEVMTRDAYRQLLG